MAKEHKPVQIDYRGPPGAAPRDGRMPIWERLMVSAIFGGIFLGVAGCLCPFEAFAALSVPALMVLDQYWTDPSPNAQIGRLILARFLTGAIIGFLIAAFVAVIFRDRRRG
jgi:hypothetical protein